MMDTYHCTWNPATDTWTPRSIHFVSRWTSCQASNKQYHETQPGHRCTDRNEYHLHGFNPKEPKMKDLIEHDDGQRCTAVHCDAEYCHTDQAHHRCNHRCIWYPRHTWFTAITYSVRNRGRKISFQCFFFNFFHLMAENYAQNRKWVCQDELHNNNNNISSSWWWTMMRWDNKIRTKRDKIVWCTMSHVKEKKEKQ